MTTTSCRAQVLVKLGCVTIRAPKCSANRVCRTKVRSKIAVLAYSRPDPEPVLLWPFFS